MVAKRYDMTIKVEFILEMTSEEVWIEQVAEGFSDIINGPPDLLQYDLITDLKEYFLTNKPFAGRFFISPINAEIKTKFSAKTQSSVVIIVNFAVDDKDEEPS